MEFMLWYVSDIEASHCLTDNFSQSKQNSLALKLGPKYFALPEDVHRSDQLTMHFLQRNQRFGLAAINSKAGFEIDKLWEVEETTDFLRGILPELMEYLEDEYSKDPFHRPTLLTCSKTPGRSPKRLVLSGHPIPDGETIYQVTRNGKSGFAGRILVLSVYNSLLCLIIPDALYSHTDKA